MDEPIRATYDALRLALESLISDGAITDGSVRSTVNTLGHCPKPRDPIQQSQSQNAASDTGPKNSPMAMRTAPPAFAD